MSADDTRDLFGDVTQQRIAALHERVGPAPAEPFSVEAARHEARFIGGFYDKVVSPLVEKLRNRGAQS